MSSPALQAHVNALNAKMEGEAKTALDEIDKLKSRPIARKSYECVVKCYDKAGKTGPADELTNCGNQCQVPYKQAQAIIQQEVNVFQERLNRAMMQCNDEARDHMTPGMENDAKKMKRFEDTVGKCFTKCVDHHIGLLGPMKERIASQLKDIKQV